MDYERERERESSKKRVGKREKFSERKVLRERGKTRKKRPEARGERREEELEWTGGISEKLPSVRQSVSEEQFLLRLFL